MDNFQLLTDDFHQNLASFFTYNIFTVQVLSKTTNYLVPDDIRNETGIATQTEIVESLKIGPKAEIVTVNSEKHEETVRLQVLHFGYYNFKNILIGRYTSDL